MDRLKFIFGNDRCRGKGTAMQMPIRLRRRNRAGRTLTAASASRWRLLVHMTGHTTSFNFADKPRPPFGPLAVHINR